jgi:hypothetical protein
MPTARSTSETCWLPRVTQILDCSKRIKESQEANEKVLVAEMSRDALLGVVSASEAPEQPQVPVAASGGLSGAMQQRAPPSDTTSYGIGRSEIKCSRHRIANTFALQFILE